MEECLFYRKQYGSEVSIRDEQKDGGSAGPMCSSGRAVKKYRHRGDRKLGSAAQEKDEDAQPVGGFWG